MKKYKQKYQFDEPQILPPVGSWPETIHVFDERSAYAIEAALAAGRPLLIRGEPGTGKSQLARAAAHVHKRLFISEVVNARSEGQDLQYRFDVVGRLGEAQALGAAGNTGEACGNMDPKRFLCPGSLWWVFDYESAEKQHTLCLHKTRRPEPLQGWKPQDGCVLLLDEIDKADADLPNSLLETLGNGAFTVPYLDQSVGLASKGEKPLVIISTNEERELPGAFVRRCLVLHLTLPKEKEEFIAWLCSRGVHHYGEKCGETVRKTAAEQLWSDRKEALRQGLTPPGQAEYLDMLRAVSNMEKTEKAQLEVLGIINEFALKKTPDSN